MTRSQILWSTAAFCVAGCCTAPPPRRFVPTSTVVLVEPQPTTLREFQTAEQQGYLIAATGRGPAFGLGDQPVDLTAGESLHVLRVDPHSGEVLVKRLELGSLARLSVDGLEARDTTYGR